MTIGRLIRKLFSNPKKNRIRVFDPEGLGKKMIDNAYSKQYPKFKRRKEEYSWREIKELGMRDRKGRKVRIWRLIKSAYDINDDIYIPFYPKGKKRN